MTKLPIEQVNIREVLDELNIEYLEEGPDVSQNWIGVNCPWCDDPMHHLGINLEHKGISCWRCGTKGNVIKYLKEITRSWRKTKELLLKYTPKEFITGYENSEEKSSLVKVELPETIPPRKKHFKYLEKRGFNPKYLTKKYRLKFTGETGNWSNRIIVPFYHNGRLITFTSISIEKKPVVKYKHCPVDKSIIPVKEYLYGYEFTNRKNVIVVEGIFDYWRIGDGAVCIFGVNPHASQIKMLSMFQRVVIAFDGDDAGRKGAEELANNLATMTEVFVVDLDDGKDPDTLSEKEILELKQIAGFQEL